MAAVLACGQGAVLSHLSAAELWAIRRPVRLRSRSGGRSEVPDTHVTVPGTAGIRKRVGIAIHRSSTLTARHCTRLDAIPVTTPARTLADVRPLLSPARFSSALREAEFLGLQVDAHFASAGTRSELEDQMLALWRRHRIPRPEVNVSLDRYEVDFLWRHERLIVEVDGWQAHGGHSAFEADRARDARLAVLGYEVVRLTWRQISSHRAGVARTIRSLLRLRAV